MKTYAISIRLLLIVTTISLLGVIFGISGSKIYDVSLAIFGSSLITLIISIIGYNIERKRVLEHFYKAIYKRLIYLNIYVHSWSVEDKCKYFMNHYLKDFISIGEAYENIYFFCDIKNKNRKYIYDYIYNKCRNMIDFIDGYYLNFAIYLNNTGENTETIQKYIKEIENKLFKESDNIVEHDFCNSIMNELNDKYYKIMYGKEMECDNGGDK